MTPLLATAGVMFAVDQACKEIVLWRLAGAHIPLARGPVRIRYVKNSTGSLGLGQNHLCFLWCCVLVSLLVLSQFTPAFRNPLAGAACGLALGGATGNLLDRLRRGGVVDFIDVGFWPVFNLADVAIVAGAVAACVVVFP